MEELLNISPIDGRYKNKTHDLENFLSEFALIKYRTLVEVKWLEFLADKKIIDTSLSTESKQKLGGIISNFSTDDAKLVKTIENETKHDVKAVEYYLRKKFEEFGLAMLNPFIHLAITSEDTNSTAYGLMLNGALIEVYLPKLENLTNKLNELAFAYSGVAVLGHTHGQPATPTTIGKEFKVFEYRLNKIISSLKQIKLCSKFSGAVGNYNCHIATYPDIDWISISKEFVESLGLEYNPVTTQIEPHDTVCLLLSHIKIINNIIKDLNSDMWLYISRGYFHEKTKAGEVGSSVMPHKVNPINHENSMANTELANGVIDALVNNLSVSRMQRDLSDSSKMRNLGVIFGHCLISISETLVGLNKLEVNLPLIESELEENYIVLSEAIQTVLRKNKVDGAYELLKSLSRGKTLTKDELHEFIVTLPIPDADKQTLLELTPASYIGLAKEIVKNN